MKRKLQHIESYLNVAITILFFAAISLITTMAGISKFDAHPDEKVHVEAVKYYKKHWLPPKIDDPEITTSFSQYGRSRLLEYDPYYFLNGKLSALTDYIFSSSMFSMRIFNILLFLVLIILFIREKWDTKPFFLVLLLSPQIWYLFSYVNSDALAFFVSILIVFQIFKKNSLYNQYLAPEINYGQLKGALFMGTLVALQILSKVNFFLILVFWAVVAFQRIITITGKRPKFIAKHLIVIAIASLLIAPRLIIDLSLYGTNKNELVAEHKEKNAHELFKPSNASDGVSYYGLLLKQKGVKLSELFSDEWNWHRTTIASFLGVYDYCLIGSPQSYYAIMLLLYFILLGYLTVKSLYKKPLDITLLPILFFSFFILITGLSLYASWVRDFQPQGRYLFAALGIMGYWFVEYRDFNKTLFLKAIICIIALIGIFDFVFVALENIPKA